MTAEILIKYVRDGLVEQEHYGYLMVSDKKRIIDSHGDTKDTPFYLRSCAKPLQASLIIDYGVDKYFDLTSEEIALCCASHTGEELHVNTAKKFLEKIGLDESYLKCGFHKPISHKEQEKLLLTNSHETIFHNNCVGKHIMMLAICKMKNWGLQTYDEPEHPLQIAIKEKINELCEVKREYPVTKDGCGVPIMSMPLKNMLIGYLNLFTDPKYEKIKNAFLNHPYIIGGENRLDTKIMENSENLIAKVGAGGLCIVVNIEKEEALVVKISDCDMKAREIVTLDTLKNLHWADIEVSHEITTLHGEVVGEIVSVL